MEKENQKYITDIVDTDKERQREQEQKEAAKRAKKRRLIPPFVMLLAGAVTSITMYVLHYNVKDMLVILFWVLLGFYVAGDLIKWMIDRFEAQIEQKRMEEGEVIEKELAEEDGTEQAVDEEEKSEE
ncbi:MAG: hypothetical protein J6B68_07650 [Lachnospiraceae bacterium]|nr:hypothetical protein [Lachnospiraceae bacterium]